MLSFKAYGILGTLNSKEAAAVFKAQGFIGI